MKRILVVEDNQANMALVSYLLRSGGHEVVGAANGESGLSLAVSIQPDVILCDLLMPGMDGFELLARLKQCASTRSIPVIAVSALAMRDDRERGLAAGFDGYLDKPIDATNFLAQIESVLRTTAVERTAHVAEMHAPTVLYVNDLNTPREHLEICLNQAGFQFVTASGTDECISIALQRKPAAIIVDMHLPSEDGFNVLFQINTHAQLKSIPTLLIAYTPRPERDKARARTLGAAALLVRPVTDAVVFQHLKGWLQSTMRSGNEGRNQ